MRLLACCNQTTRQRCLEKKSIISPLAPSDFFYNGVLQIATKFFKLIKHTQICTSIFGFFLLNLNYIVYIILQLAFYLTYHTTNSCRYMIRSTHLFKQLHNISVWICIMISHILQPVDIQGVFKVFACGCSTAQKMPHQHDHVSVVASISVKQLILH